MRILGIETSCDETAAAIVENGTKVRSSVVSSSLLLHRTYGGIIPEIAFRKQLETITPVVEEALAEAATPTRSIDAIAVTTEPGLLGSLFVGISFARALSLSLGKPLIEINHLHSHIYAAFLDKKNPLRFPCVGLVVSGGHTSLYYLKDMRTISLLGSTLDDACGEAFDKVAKILGLGYPGGPLIEKAARQGNASLRRFTCSRTDKPLDFSFSGIKTAVLYEVRRHTQKNMSRTQVNDLCASFQDACLNTLVDKSVLACTIKKVRTLVVGGGVAANQALRVKFAQAAAAARIDVFFPEVRNCMDNAAMVAGLGYHCAQRRQQR